MPVRVLKVGGSLFEYPALVPALRDWLSLQLPAHTVLVWGGGPFVDAVRGIARRFSLNELECHWLAVRLMDCTARIGHLLLPESIFCDRFEELVELCKQSSNTVVVFSCESFLQREEPTLPGECLPWSWNATSDSIAARLAFALSADELVLLKSADPTEPFTAEHLATAGYVDSHFPKAVARLSQIRVVNLTTLKEWRLQR